MLAEAIRTPGIAERAWASCVEASLIWGRRRGNEDDEPTMPASAHIIILARYPVPGKAKTRLIPALGIERAAFVHRRMTEHVVGVARAAGVLGHASVSLHFTDGREQDFRSWLGHDINYTIQPPGHLGIRLHQAFKSAFKSGATAALAIGTDVPALTPEILQQAIEALHNHDIALGPAVDGGYYLIGMTRLHPKVFVGIDWGTASVCDQTRAAIDTLNLRVAELPRLSDIDRPEDLPSLRSDPRFADLFTGKPLVSVIVPTLNEAIGIGRILDRLYHEDAIEVVVSDGGSCDGTCQLAAQSGARVLEVCGGRAAQQNAGAAAAHGRLLLFLHADTLPPNGYADLIRHALNRPAAVAGAFRFQTDSRSAVMRTIERIANFRSTVFQWPYGDQGLFLEKRVFDELGGFASLPIMEDFELVRRLRRRGVVVTLQEAAITSARRWQQLGLMRTTLTNQIMIAGFLVGAPMQRLNRLYRSSRGTGCRQ